MLPSSSCIRHGQLYLMSVPGCSRETLTMAVATEPRSQPPRWVAIAALACPAGPIPPILVDIFCDQSYLMDMKKIAAAKFKEQCLSVLDHLDPEGVVVTKHGKPVARVLPAERASADLIGALRGRISVKGDVQSTGAIWKANG